MTILFSLHPRFKVFITGAAIFGGMIAESIAVWDRYVKESKEKEAFVVNVG